VVPAERGRDSGLVAATQACLDRALQGLERAASSGLPITVVGSLPPLPPPAARAAYRVVQEALTNAAKHAPGMSVQVDLGGDPGTGEAVSPW
jgi:signal transduction histidine kinase